MDQLAVIQQHLDVEREKNTILRDNIAELCKGNRGLKSTVRRYTDDLHKCDLEHRKYKLRARLIGIVMLGTLTYIGSSNMNYADQVRDLTAKNKEFKDQEQRIGNTIKHANEAWRQLDECKTANEALIEHATPKSVIKAIKSTPLPTLVKGA